MHKMLYRRYKSLCVARRASIPHIALAAILFSLGFYSLVSITGCGTPKTFSTSAVKLSASGHGNTLTWNPEPTGVVSTCVYKDGIKITPCLSAATLTYTDSAVNPGETHTYYLTAIATITGAESAISKMVSGTTPGVIIPPPLLCPTCPPIGSTVKVGTLSATVRATAVANGYGAALGTVTSGMQATVVGGPSAATTTWSWMQVHFASCTGTAFIAAGCTGWMGSDNLTIVTTPPPPPPSLTLACIKNVCTIGGGVSGQTGTIQIMPSGPSASWSKP